MNGLNIDLYQLRKEEKHMKNFHLDLLVVVPDELSIEDFEYEFRTLIENQEEWQAAGAITEEDDLDNVIPGKTKILTLIT